jgi:hypothetical protein
MNKKISTYLKEENLLTLLSQNNFIIPEIQREYVWGENQKVIKGFLEGLKTKIGVCCNTCNLPATETKINIGFLYSYKPEYVKIEHERFLDENLIDGQQRFTTLFLLLFFCSLKEIRSDGKNRKEEFLTLIRFEEKIKMCFDFRVRDLTKRFLLELLEKVNNINQLQNIDKQTWFLKDYQNDVSIKSMRKALNYIQEVFSNEVRYYNHLINYIVFWHFKTEATSQGEELYITMNARGEELADNEVAKAALMIGGSELYDWGKKWEEWQHFFWKNRDKKDNNPSADKGFNGFLACIAGLEYYLKDKIGKKSEKEIQNQLTLVKVESYFNAFKLLIESKEQFVCNYNYSEWVVNCLKEIWIIFNKDETDWFVDYQDKNKSNERKRMVFIWSWLYYITAIENQGKNIIKTDLYRILRFFYIRYNNFNRSVSTLKKTIDHILKYGLWNTLDNDMGNEVDVPEEETDSRFRTTEEAIKITYFINKINDNDLLSIEELIWQIEDHPLNLDGQYVGNINITHLIDLNESVGVDKLKEIRDIFYSLFPDNTKNGSNILKTILLHYGDFYKDTSLSYYTRYDFSDWKRNIRKHEFKNLINSLSGRTIEQLLFETQESFLNSNSQEIKDSNSILPESMPLRKWLFYYSLIIPYDILWKEGERIIIRYDTESPRLFKDEYKKILNSKGSFHGNSGNSDLWIMATRINESPIEIIKQKCNIIMNKSITLTSH